MKLQAILRRLGTWMLSSWIGATVSGLAQAEDIHIELTVPMPDKIVRSIIPKSEIPEDAKFNEMIDKGIVERWMEPVNLYFVAEGPVDQNVVDMLIKRQVLPLLTAINEVSGVAFEQVFDLEHANAVIVFSATSVSAAPRLNPDTIQRWMKAPESDFADVRAAFKGSKSDCFRFVSAPEHRIERAIGFVSSELDDMDQEKCMARNLLYFMGLKGTTDGTDSAREPGTSSREIAIIDNLALGILYSQKSKPGMTLHQAMQK